ncbi:MAG TPA: hypothetical protein VEH77_05370 [Roseiarcus sp.]|nr:hypothetical protein [Roseiarcus sp.]
MIRLLQGFAVALGVALTLSAANAQTGETPARRPTHAAKHQAPAPEGREITVQKGTPSWLTLGPERSVGTGTNYVTSTFDQPSAVQGTFSGFRGRERLVSQYGVPGAPLFRF